MVTGLECMLMVVTIFFCSFFTGLIFSILLSKSRRFGSRPGIVTFTCSTFQCVMMVWFILDFIYDMIIIFISWVAEPLKIWAQLVGHFSHWLLAGMLGSTFFWFLHQPIFEGFFCSTVWCPVDRDASGCLLFWISFILISTDFPSG